MSAATAHHGDSTSGPKFYWKLAVVLAIVTILEVWFPYAIEDIPSLHPFYMPVLGIMSLFKFVMVCGFYMHLKHDPPILTGFFTFSLLIATGFMTAFLFLFYVVI